MSNIKSSEGKHNSSIAEWYIPLTYTTKSLKSFKTAKTESWLGPYAVKNKIINTVTLFNPAQQDDWLLFNIKATGKELLHLSVTKYSTWS